MGVSVGGAPADPLREGGRCVRRGRSFMPACSGASSERRKNLLVAGRKCGALTRRRYRENSRIVRPAIAPTHRCPPELPGLAVEASPIEFPVPSGGNRLNLRPINSTCAS